MRTAVQSRTIAETDADPANTAATECPAASDPRFHESTRQRVRRLVLGTAYALRPNRIALMPRLALMSLSHLLAPAGTRDELPDHPVYYSARGLVGISDELSVEAVCPREVLSQPVELEAAREYCHSRRKLQQCETHPW